MRLGMNLKILYTLPIIVTFALPINLLSATTQTLTGTASVTDGDTLEIHGGASAFTA